MFMPFRGAGILEVMRRIAIQIKRILNFPEHALILLITDRPLPSNDEFVGLSCCEKIGKRFGKGYGSLACFRLRLLNDRLISIRMDNRPTDMKQFIFKINVLPLQPQHFLQP